MVLAVVSLVVLVGLFQKKKEPVKTALVPEPIKAFRTCPLCGQNLQRGETVHSTMFKSGNDRLMDIMGCPYCRTDKPVVVGKTRNTRYCPVCKRVLDKGETMPARAFYREKGMHIHVLGCGVCRRVQR